METEITKAALGTVAKSSDKALSKIVDLVFSKKLLNQKRLETLSGTQDKKDAELIEKGLAEFRNGKLILIEDSIGNPTSPLGLILANNNSEQELNIGKCLNKAYEHLSEKNDEEISADNISDTFFNKWMNYGKEVSESELQDLWGRILSEEISVPNSVNYLVLNTISLMSKIHFINFNKLLNYIIGGKYIVVDGTILDAKINFNDITELEIEELVDLGLIESINGVNALSKQLQEIEIYEQKQKAFRRDDAHPFILSMVSEKPIELTFFKLTTVGSKLLKIAEKNLNQIDLNFKLAEYLLTLESCKPADEIFVHQINNNYIELLTSIKRK